MTLSIAQMAQRNIIGLGNNELDVEGSGRGII
jgi:hypothetical protein